MVSRGGNGRARRRKSYLCGVNTEEAEGGVRDLKATGPGQAHQPVENVGKVRKIPEVQRALTMLSRRRRSGSRTAGKGGGTRSQQ